MDFIQGGLQLLGTLTIIVFLWRLVINKCHGLTVVKLEISRNVINQLEYIGFLSGNDLLNVARRALAVYDRLWRAKERKESIWIRKLNGSEQELELQ